MTKAEQALFDAALTGEFGMLTKYRQAVNLERLAPDFVETAVPVFVTYWKAKQAWDLLEDQLVAAGQTGKLGMHQDILDQGFKLMEVSDAA